jgi:TolB-like protein
MLPAVAFLFSLQTLGADSETVLVLDPATDSKSPPAAALVTGLADAVAQTLSKRGVRAFTSRDLQDLLELDTARQLVGCHDVACVSQAGAALKVDRIVTSQLRRLGAESGSTAGSWALVLRLQRASGAAASVRANEQAPKEAQKSELYADDAALLAGVAALTEALFGWSAADAVAFALPTDRPRTFAVFDVAVTAKGQAKNAGQNLTSVLAQELTQMEDAKVIGRDDIVAMLSLESEKQLVGCGDNTACLAEIGGALGASYLVTGSIGDLGESFLVTLRLLDPKHAEVLHRVSESFTGDASQLAGAVRHAARTLVGMPPSAGALTVDVRPSDVGPGAATLFIDGNKLGPWNPSLRPELQSGRHSVRVTSEDFLDWTSDVYVEPYTDQKTATALRITLLEAPAPWYRTWWFWTIAVGSAAVAAGATVGIVVGTSGNGANAPQMHDFSLEVGLPQR